ncbi:MAG: PD40 domain-containing protein [Verrucomicrobia bacterium]|nr:PD40 domain-containing protein [Verrucomicrobiota bacterium]
MKHIVLFLSALPLILSGSLRASDDPVAAWEKDVRIAPVSATPGRHTTHSYYVANPESPDGKHVLFFASTHPAAHVGSVVMLDRATGRETVLAENVHTEDAHRAACQQWLSGGRRVAFHEVVGKRWHVVAVDTATLAKTVVAEDHQVGFGRPDGDLLPLYGCHWNPGPFRDLELWDATTGKLRTAAKISEVEAKYGEWLQKEFAGKPVSIFFPVLSPDLKRVFFKIAAGNGGDDFMSKNASQRQGTVCYDFAKAACVWQRNQWGHPAWHPDSRHIFEVGNTLFDTDAPGTYTRLKDVPSPRGTHPSVSPDGVLMVTDGLSATLGGKTNEWGIVVGDMSGGKWALVHSFDQSKGANSWRRSHPHPVFSADGKRIYYNVNDGEFTRLFVAERK